MNRVYGNEKQRLERSQTMLKPCEIISKRRRNETTIGLWTAPSAPSNRNVWVDAASRYLLLPWHIHGKKHFTSSLSPSAFFAFAFAVE